MTGKLNGFKPTLGTAIAVVMILSGVVATWGVSAYRLDDHERRLGSVEKLVGEMRVDVAVTRKLVEKMSE